MDNWDMHQPTAKYRLMEFCSYNRYSRTSTKESFYTAVHRTWRFTFNDNCIISRGICTRIASFETFWDAFSVISYRVIAATILQRQLQSPQIYAYAHCLAELSALCVWYHLKQHERISCITRFCAIKMHLIIIIIITQLNSAGPFQLVENLISSSLSKDASLVKFWWRHNQYFYVKLVTDRQTNKQKDKHQVKHNLFGGSNK